MDKLTEQQMAKGRERFLAANNDINSRVKSLTKDHADALGITLDELREAETMRELREFAHANSLDSAEVFWSCVADTAEEFDQMIKARDEAISRII